MAESEVAEDFKQDQGDINILDIIPEIEQKEELDHKNSSTNLENEPVEIISDANTDCKKESSDKELRGRYFAKKAQKCLKG